MLKPWLYHLQKSRNAAIQTTCSELMCHSGTPLDCQGKVASALWARNCLRRLTTTQFSQWETFQPSMKLCFPTTTGECMKSISNSKWTEAVSPFSSFVAFPAHGNYHTTTDFCATQKGWLPEIRRPDDLDEVGHYISKKDTECLVQTARWPRDLFFRSGNYTPVLLDQYLLLWASGIPYLFFSCLSVTIFKPL